jgi:hypothetical protein
MPQTSIKLFTAWAAKHKEAIALEDQLAVAQRDGLSGIDQLARSVDETKTASERMLAEAMALFRSELQARGIKE